MKNKYMTIQIKEPDSMEEFINSLIDVIYEYKETKYHNEYDDNSLKELIIKIINK